MAESKVIQSVINQAAIKAATAMMVAPRNADKGSRPA